MFPSVVSALPQISKRFCSIFIDFLTFVDLNRCKNVVVMKRSVTEDSGEFLFNPSYSLDGHISVLCFLFCCHSELSNRLNRNKTLRQSLLSVAKGPHTGVVKLQTMPCLFEAYEHVLFLLEKVFTPMFCHSDEVRHHKTHMKGSNLNLFSE